MKANIILLAILSMIINVTFSSCVLAQSQIPFSQYMNNELRINPAFAGNLNALSFAIAIRKQWVGVSEAPMMYSLTGHTPINNNTAVGLSIVNSSFGIINNSVFSGQFAYTLKYPSNRRLTFGVNAGISYLNYNFNIIEDIKDENDPVIGNAKSNLGAIIGAGVYYTSSNFEAGISSPEFFRPAINNIVQIPNDIYLYSKYKYQLGYNWQIISSIFLQYNAIQEELLFNMNIGMAYNRVIYIGMGTKSLHELTMMSRIRLAEQFVLGYSLDIPISSDEKKINGLSHEMMLNYIVLLKNYNSTWDKVYF